MTAYKGSPSDDFDDALLQFATFQPSPANLPNGTQDILITQVPSTSQETQAGPASGKNVNARITTLWVLFAIGVVGNTFALIWLWHRRHQKSRVLKIILGLVTADLSVCFLVMLLSAVYEMMGYRWLLGNFSCKIVMFSQTTVITSSSYMLVLLAVDRHMAVRNPMKGSYPTARLVVLVWIFTAILSIPQLRVWSLQTVEVGGISINTCKTIFNPTGDSRKFIYLLYAAIMSFCLPFIITSVAYVRICKKIWDKAREARADQSNGNVTFALVDKNGRIRLPRSGARTLQLARGKTLRMSITIISMFLLCGFPYFLVNMLKTFTTVNKTVDAIFGIFAVANSSINPYIFLWFSRKSVVTERYNKCKRRCCSCFLKSKVDRQINRTEVFPREKVTQAASSGGLTQDSTTDGSTQTTARSSKVTLTMTLSAQQYV